MSSQELEELTLPQSVQALEPREVGTSLGPDGRVRVEQFLRSSGRLNLYLAIWKDDTGKRHQVELREAPADHAELQREAEVLAQVQYSMLPKLYATFEDAFKEEHRRYLTLECIDGTSLEQALSAGIDTNLAVSLTLQLCQLLRRLHQAGWALLGLSPADISLGQPLRLTRLGMAVRIGEPPCPFLVAGYSAPEVATQSPVTGKEDVYTLGAILYRALTGESVPEEGLEPHALAAKVHTPGAPQLLALALSPVDSRADLDQFYQHLLTFKRRLARTAVALDIAGGTTVGLNHTRLVNEDAFGYRTWCTADADRIKSRSVLCVIDGMGGMEAGEVASRAALEAVMHGASAAPETDPRELIKQAASAVIEAAQGRQVGATITCAIVRDGELQLGHVGDTRAYLLRDGALSQLTRDHSLVAAMVASGMLTKEEARGHPDSNKVLRSLGGQRELPNEYIDTLATLHGEEVPKLLDGDVLLLCTDGVWGVLEDEVLEEILAAAASSTSAVQTVIKRVLDGQAPDNATLIVVRCSEMPAS